MQEEHTNLMQNAYFDSRKMYTNKQSYQRESQRGILDINKFGE